MEEMARATVLLEQIIEQTNKLDYGIFGGVWCMILEEYCKEHEIDIREASVQMMVIINEMQDELGRY